MTDVIERAFRRAPRRNFLPAEVQAEDYLDQPLPIGFGQTNSQPRTVSMMLDWLEVEPGQKVLDVGSGSGWTSALLSQLTGPKGRVIAVEIVPELLRFGHDNCDRLGLRNIDFHQARHDTHGWPANAPYDRILVNAAAQRLPEELLDQLAGGGRLVIPIGSTVVVIDKDWQGRLVLHKHEGFRFVPLL